MNYQHTHTYILDRNIHSPSRTNLNWHIFSLGIPLDLGTVPGRAAIANELPVEREQTVQSSFISSHGRVHLCLMVH